MSNIPLSDLGLDDDEAIVAAELRDRGETLYGGGAAPLVWIQLADSPFA